MSSEIPDASASLYGDTRAKRQVVVAAWVAAILGIVTVVMGWIAWTDKNEGLVVALAVFWAIGPPIWFWYDYFQLYRPHAPQNSFDSFKHGQQLSAAIWAAIAISLAALAGHDHFKKETHVPQASVTPPRTP